MGRLYNRGASDVESVWPLRHAHPQLHTMTPPKILLVIVVLAVSSSLAQYDTYEDRDEDEDHEEGKAAVDYSRYFNGLGGPVSPVSQAQAANDQAGFVQPLDFNGFFGGGNFGLDGLAGGASQQVFHTPGGVSGVLPLSTGGFPLHHEQPPSNISGFVKNMNFPSLFDTSGSASENGFRPHDFLPRSSPPVATSHGSFYSPGFTSLQRDVDTEVDYQRKEEADIEQSRPASRRQPLPKEEDEEEPDDFDISEYEFDEDDPPALDPNDRSPQKYTKQPYEVEDDESYRKPNKKTPQYKAPYNKVNQQYHPPIQSRPAQAQHKKPLPTLSDPEDVYIPVNNHKRKEYNDGTTYPRQRPTSPKNIRPTYSSPTIPVRQVHNNPPSQYSPSYNRHPAAYNAGRSLNKNPVSYYSVFPAYPGPPPQSRHAYPSKSPSHDFVPSPRDPHLDSAQRYTNGRGQNSPRSRPPNREGLYSLPQTEYPTVVRKNSKNIPSATTSASENKKTCHKIQKKMDSKDFARFKRQQMTCYVCKNKEKGNSYEECSYESEPKAKSFYKGSEEAYSSDTIVPRTNFRSKRSPAFVPANNFGDSDNKEQKLMRKVRQYEESYDPDENGHGPENYRFGPEHFRNTNGRHKKSHTNANVRRNTDEEDYDENESEEDETDIEKEYQPPGASENDDCEQVNKNGLICMVCTNPKTGGSYEQCSYASDPDENKYEYARQSTYGTKRRPLNDRYKRFSSKDVKNKPHKQRKKIIKKRHNSHNHPERSDDFKNGKSKRKKVNRRYNHERPTENSEAKVDDINRESEIPGVVGLDPFFYGSPGKPYNPDDYDERGRKIKRKTESESEDDDEGDGAVSSTEEEAEETNPTYEDSFFRLFPELAGTNPYTGENLNRRNTKDKRGRNKKEEDDDHPEIPYEEVEDEEESESKQKSKKVKPGFEYGVDLPGYYFDDDESKKDLEKVLDEFTQKNRSECKKVMKDKMTCYQCLDEKGMQHEECMFVAASEPKSKHLAYHEVKEFRVTPKEKEETNSADLKDKQNSTSTSTTLPLKQGNAKYSGYIDNTSPKLKALHSVSRVPRRNRKKKVNGDSDQATEIPVLMVTDNEGQPALTYDILKVNPRDVITQTVVPQEIPSFSDPLQRTKRKPQDVMSTAESRLRSKESRGNNQGDEQGGTKDNREDNNEREEPQKTRTNYNSVPPDPEGFQRREGPEGAYSHETEPTYDSVLKISLPKYMLTRSEHERIFDEVLRSG